MNKILKNNKGLSLVELMAAIVIAGAITGSIAMFLVSHISSYETTQDIIDIQYEAQLALNQMSEIAMESRGIYEITNPSNTSVKDVPITEVQPNLIAFENEQGQYQVFQRGSTAETSNIIYYRDSIDASLADGDNEIFIKNVDNMSIKPMDGSTFDECKSIEIIIQMSKGDADLTVNTQVKFRNK